MSADLPSVFAVQQGKRPSLCADFSWMFVGNSIYAGGQFAMLVLLAKLVRPELVGQYALGLAVVYPVMMLTNLQLRAVMPSGARRQTDFGHYLSLRLLTPSLALVIIFGITQVLRYGWELTVVVLMVGVAYAIETISDVYYARLQLHDRMDGISKSLIARALLSTLGLAVATYVSGSLIWGLAGVVLARASVFIGYDICERTHGLSEQSKWFSRNKALTPRFDLRVHRELLWTSLPLGIVVLLTSLYSTVPAYFIKHGLGVAWAVGLHPTCQIFCGRQPRSIQFASRQAPRLWGDARSVRNGCFQIGRTRDSYHTVSARICRASRTSSLDHGGRRCLVYGPVFGIRDDCGRLLQFAGHSEYFRKPNPFRELLLAGCTAGAPGRNLRDADRRDRAAYRERPGSSHRHANAHPSTRR